MKSSIYAVWVQFFATVSCIPTAKIDSSKYPVVIAIPDTHGDVQAAAYSVWVAYSKLTPAKEQVAQDAFLDRINDAVIWALDQPIGKLSALPPSISPISEKSTSGIALVQLGDLVDRGPYSRLCMDLFEVLPLLLPGWKVLKLYGNHDIWTIIGDPRFYISESELNQFDKTDHEKAYLKRKKLFQPGGVYYDRYLNSYLGMARWEGPLGLNTLFVHAGIDMRWFDYASGFFEKFTISRDVDDFNSELKHLMTNPKLTDEDRDTILFLNADKTNDINPRSFIWTRLFAEGDESAVCELLDKTLEIFNVERMVVGHTPPRRGKSERKAVSKCNGKFLMADMAMSRWMWDGVNPEPFALIMDSRFHNKVTTTAHYFRSGVEEVLTETYLPTSTTVDIGKEKPASIGHPVGVDSKKDQTNLLNAWRGAFSLLFN
jgi:hypothetical protein